MSATARVSFPSGSTFHADLKLRVQAYFDRTGREVHGGWAIRRKSAILGAWLLGSYALVLFADVGAVLAALLTVSIGLAMAGIGFGVMHDANHGSYGKSQRLNRVMGFSMDLLGASSHVWRHKHNILHHTYTNIAGLDTDIDASSMLRLAPSQPWLRFHSFQHLYIWILYAVFPLKWWFLDDSRELASGQIALHSFPPARGWALARAVAGKAAFVAWAFVVPLLLHPTWKLVPLWLLGVATLGVVTSVVFQLAHCVGGADHPEANAGGQMETGWAEHQIATTVDFARRSRVLAWYLGGLNFQVEHHLFPRICHVHYPAVSAIVQEACDDHHILYSAEPTLRSALASNLRWLRKMGRRPAYAGLSLSTVVRSAKSSVVGKRDADGSAERIDRI
jgi:linoleoyl-CoA desaturase